MNIQKFVAWDKLPSLLPKTEETSSSGSHSGGSEEEEVVSTVKHKNVSPNVDSSIPAIEVPPPVRNVLIKLDTAQLERAKKEISKKLFRILDNVNRTYERYKKEKDDYDPELEREYLLTPTWQEKTRRTRLLDEVAIVLEESVFKVQELKMALEALKSWHEMLTKVEREDIEAPIDEMGESLLDLVNTINSNVQHLLKICSTLSEQKSKFRRKSVARAGMFKLWKEKVAENPKDAEPMTPEQMLENEPLAFTRNQEVASLIQELVDSSIFNKGECVALKYILAMLLNLMKAFSVLTRQCRGLRVKVENMEALDKKKLDPYISQLQRELHIAMEKKAVLEAHVRITEEKCKILTTTNEILQKELQDTHERGMSKAPVTKSHVPVVRSQEKRKDEKEKLSAKVSSEQRLLRTAKSDEKKKEQGPKPEVSGKEKQPVAEQPVPGQPAAAQPVPGQPVPVQPVPDQPIPESLLKHIEPQAQDSRMKVFTKLPGKDTPPKQDSAKISLEKLQAELYQKESELRELTSVVAALQDEAKPLDTEPPKEGMAEKFRRASVKIKITKLEDRKKLQRLQIRRGRRSKEKDLVVPQSLGESSTPTFDTSSDREMKSGTPRERAHRPSVEKVTVPPIEMPEQSVAAQPLPEQPVAAPLVPEQPVAAPLVHEQPIAAPLVPEQPVAAQPVPGQPAEAQPVPGQPAAFQPVPGQPAAFQPVPDQPAAFQPVPGQPAAFQPVPGQPVAFQPEPGQPVAFQPVPGQPVEVQPGQPVEVQPWLHQPVAFQPVPGQPVAFQPVLGQPVAFQQVPGQPVAFQQVLGQPVAFQQVPGQPVAFQQVPGQPVTFQQVPGQPVAFQQVPGQPVAFQQVPGQPVAFQPVPGQPVAFQQVPGQPVAFQQVPGQPVAFQQVPGQPVVFQPVPGQPVAFQQVPGQPVAFQQVPGQPVAFQQVPGQPVAFQQVPGQPVAFQQVPGQPVALQQVPGQPVAFQPVPGLPVEVQPGQPVEVQPWPGQPVALQPVPGQPVEVQPGQPVAFQPVPGQPVVFQLVPGQPTVVQPWPGQPTTVQPWPGQPVAVQPVPGQPVAVQPWPGQPGVVQPLPRQPGAVQPLPGQPEAVLPWPVQPGVVQPLPYQPGAVQPFPGQATAAQPVPGQLVAVQPFPGQPVSAQPVAVQPLPGQQVAAQPLPGQPVAAQPLPGQPVAAQPLPGQPVAAQPLPGQPVTAQPLPGQQEAVQPVPEQPEAVQPLPGQPEAVQPLPGQPEAVQAFPGPPEAVQPLPGQPVTVPFPRIQQSVEGLRQKKSVTFLDDVLVPKPQDTEVPDTGPSQEPFLEMAEDTAALERVAAFLELPVGKLKEIQETKEIQAFARMLAEVPQPRPLDIIGNIIIDLGAKLQELAREKGGVLDAETIKEFFEALAITQQETMPEQVAESQPQEKTSRRLRLAKKLPPPPFVPVITKEKKEKPKSTALKEEEKFTGEDVGFVLQEFQTAILASLQDKMVKFKKGPPTGWKRPVKFQPTDPQAKHVFRIVDRKLEECFSWMKQKYLGALKQQMLLQSTPSKGALQEDEEKVMKRSESSSSDFSFKLSEESSSSSYSLSGEKEQPVRRRLRVRTWKQRRSEQEEGLEQMRTTEEPQDEPEGEPKPQEGEISIDEEEDEQFLMSHLPDILDEEESEIQKWEEELRLLSEAQENLQQMAMVTRSEEKQAQEDTKEQDWYMQLQDRLVEEQVRLLDERQRLDEEAQYLDHVRGLFEVQLYQWEEQQHQREEQEQLWKLQLEHWQELQQKQEAQEQYWEAERQRQKEQQILLQKETERLEQAHKEHVRRQGEEAKEQWRWEKMKAMHREQQRLWQVEDEQQAEKRQQMQQQLADHEERMEALLQNYIQQEHRQNMWLQEQQEAQKEQERLWEMRWMGQLKRWRRQLQRQRAQQRSLLNLLDRGHRLQDRQPMRQVLKEERPQLRPPTVKTLQGAALEQIPLQPKVLFLRKGSSFLVSPELTPRSSLEELEELSSDVEHSLFPKLFRKTEIFHAPAITERRYWMDVKAQRKNLELLNEGLKKSKLPFDDYIKAKEIIRQALQSNAERLGLLFWKYIIFRQLQAARTNLIAQLDIAKYAKDGAKMKDLYKMVEKLDAYSKVVLERWTVKQAVLEKKHQRFLGKMIAFFAQLRLVTKIPIKSPCPLLIKAADTTQEAISMPHIESVFLKTKPYPSPLITVKKVQDIPYATTVREPTSEHIESLWKTDLTELSVPIGPKTPVSLLWSEAYGMPDIPRLLELDISSVKNKPLQEIKSRIQQIPRWKITGYDFMHL